MDEIEKLEEDITQDVEFNNQDLETLNVNIWFNKLESRLQHCLIKEEMNYGFLQYQMLINHAEIIAISGGKLDEDSYKKDLEAEKNILKEKHSDNSDNYQMALAMAKYKLILKSLLNVKKSNAVFRC